MLAQNLALFPELCSIVGEYVDLGGNILAADTWLGPICTDYNYWADREGYISRNGLDMKKVFDNWQREKKPTGTQEMICEILQNLI